MTTLWVGMREYDEHATLHVCLYPETSTGVLMMIITQRDTLVGLAYLVTALWVDMSHECISHPVGITYIPHD